MTRVEFLIYHPEFSTAATATVEAVLAATELRVSDSWGAQRPEIVALTAAAALAVSPGGRYARLASEAVNAGRIGGGPSSTYAERLRELRISHACCLSRVIGPVLV
jgi:hypothetical protein